MGQLIYPVVPGWTFDFEVQANWGTRKQQAISGRTLRLSDYVNPIWNFSLVYSVLEDNPASPQTSAPNALRQILDFFNSRAGAFDDFLFQHPTDNQALGQIAVPAPGDTTATQYQLARRLVSGGFSEWVIAPGAVTAVYFNGAPQSPAGYTVSNLGLLQFSAAVGGGITVTADFSFYYRVTFTDALNPSYFFYRLAELKQVKLTSIVL